MFTLKAISRTAGELHPPEGVGWVLAHDVHIEGDSVGTDLHKGRILTENDLLTLNMLGPHKLHLIEMDNDDVHEDVAALEIAEAVSGPGLSMKGPAQSQVTLFSDRRGLLDINIPALAEVNNSPVVAVFSLYDGQVVEPGDRVAGIKIGPLIVDHKTINAVKDICRLQGPPIRVRPFLPLRVAILDRELLSAERRQRHEDLFNRRIDWLGGQLDRVIAEQPDTPDTLAYLVREQLAAKPDLLVIAGTNSTDPLDHAIQAVVRCGGEIVRIGMPAHPGSTYWLAELAGTPILGIGSCGMLSGSTVLDIIVPRYFAGLPVDQKYLSTLGHGGMLNQLMKFRFPSYES